MGNSFFSKKLVEPVIDLMRQGIPPEKIAISITLGVALGVFPVLGSTTLLCALAAVTLGLNLDAEAARRGLGNLRIVTSDMNSFDTGERFDRIVSIEMFEHMRNYERLLARAASWLKTKGTLFVHIFAHRRFAAPHESDHPGHPGCGMFFA